MKSASRVKAEPVTYIWPKHIPRRSVTLLDGDPGISKSQVGVDLAARLSRADVMPDGTIGDYGNGKAVIYNFEDPLELQKVRLKAAGANLTQIYLPQHDRPLLLPTDLIVMEREIFEVMPALVIIDPIGAIVPGTLGRPVVDGLSQIAKRTGAAIIVVRHLTKSAARNPLMAGGGAAGAIGAARAGFLINTDPDDPDRRIMVSTKNNAARAPESLVYRIGEKKVRVSNRRYTGSFIDWQGASAYSANEVMGSRTRTSVQAEAKAFLESQMANGPRLAKDLIDLAAAGPQITKSTLQRARDNLHITSHEVGARIEHPQFWVWIKPGQEKYLKDERYLTKMYQQWQKNRHLVIKDYWSSEDE